MGTGQPGVGWLGALAHLVLLEVAMCLGCVCVKFTLRMQTEHTLLLLQKCVGRCEHIQAPSSGCHLFGSPSTAHTSRPPPSSDIHADNPVRVRPHLKLTRSHTSHRTRRRMSHEGMLRLRLFHKDYKLHPFLQCAFPPGPPGPQQSPRPICLTAASSLWYERFTLCSTTAA